MTHKSGQCFWIIGASSGIGKALAVALAAQGKELIISSRSTETLEAIAAQHPELIRVLACDVSDGESMLSLFRDSMPAIEKLDGIFICVGVCDYIDLPDFNPEAFRKAADINYLGTVNACAAAWPLLKQAARLDTDKKPFIVGLCSMSSYLGFPRAEAYAASKAAMACFLNALRADAGHWLDVIPAYLGFVDTPMTAGNDFPMPFLATPQDAARAIMKKLQERPLRIVYPWRLHAMLKLFSCLQTVWYGWVIPRLRRSGDML